MSNLGVHELPRYYDTIRWDFMRPQGPHMPITESSVSIPNALFIRDEKNDLWTLGFDYDERAWASGMWEYDCVRNAEKTGEFCRVIEYKVNSKGTRQIRIWGTHGTGSAYWKYWTGRQFV